MGENSFNTGLKATNDAYATLAGVTPPAKGENLVEVPDPVEPVDPAEAGLQPVEGAAKPKPAAKKVAAKKAAKR